MQIKNKESAKIGGDGRRRIKLEGYRRRRLERMEEEGWRG